MPKLCETRGKIAACVICVLLWLQMLLLMGLSEALWASQGKDVRQRGSMVLDCSNASQGYVLVRAKKTSAKMKLRIVCDGVTYDYDLNNEGEFEIFPLQMGSGKYRFSLYKRVSGNNYARDAELNVEVKIKDEHSAFLYPSQYVDYTADSPAVAMSYQLCEGLESDAEKLEAIRDFMVSGFTYDYVRALTAPKRYLGDIDGCFESRIGLCQDLAAVAACMLRVQGIPTQLVIGYAGNTYHAWNNVLIDGEYQRLDITGLLSFMNKNTVYTAERIY